MKTWFVAASTLVLACTRPPPPVTPIVLQSAYLSRDPPQTTGELAHVRDGVFCSDDDAFSLPVVPFPNGPTDIRDWYKGHGITTSVEMYDANESVVIVTRTKIRPDLPRDQVLEGVEESLASLDQSLPEQSTHWVSQKGVVHLQHINPAPGYDGKRDAMNLAFFQAHAKRYGPSESCRVDRYFVGAAYYFQITVAVRQSYPLLELCKVGQEIAAWTFEHLQVGKGCGKAIPWVEPQLPAEAAR